MVASSSSLPSPAVSSEPTASLAPRDFGSLRTLRLPNELILEIFQHLSYYDLKYRIPLVCRAFKDIVAMKGKISALDKLLHRDVLSTRNRGLRDEAEFVVHPLIRKIGRVQGYDTHGLLLLDEDGVLKRFSFATLPWNENAVSPAAPSVHYLIQGKAQFSGEVRPYNFRDPITPVTFYAVASALYARLSTWDGDWYYHTHGPRGTLELDKVKVDAEGDVTLIYDFIK